MTSRTSFVVASLFFFASCVLSASVERQQATPNCPPADVLVNGAFYGYPNPSTYAPWTLSSTAGSPGCQYIQSYTPCMAGGGFGASDPNCFECRYGQTGGSDAITQSINLTPGCLYTVEATVACDSGATYDQVLGSAGNGTPHVYFRATVDHDIVIPQQTSCPDCAHQNPPCDYNSCGNAKPGCEGYPYPTYRVVTGQYTAPAGKTTGKFKFLVSQPDETGRLTVPLLVTAVRMYTGTTPPSPY